MYEVDWNSLKVMDKSKNRVESKVQEAFHIFQRQPQMNRIKVRKEAERGMLFFRRPVR